MAAYKTPGVYIKEIAVFPPSVAQVATAIPAFIGYTEKAIKDGEDVSLTPTRIDSLPDVRETFGGAPPQDDFRTYLDDELRVTKVEIKPKYFMFDSLQLFYENGGGACYIVSVGSYQDTVDLAKLKDGLKKLEKVDEPTLILFPDACLLSSAAELSNIQVATLAQCVKLQDRFGVFDLMEDPSAANPNWEAGRDAFRDGVGVNGLKYGAAYTPWLKVRYEKQVSLDKLTLVQAKNDQEIALAKLTTDPDLSQMIAAAMTAIQDRNTVDADIAAISTPESTLRDKYNTLVSVVILADAEVEDKFKEIFVFLKSIAKTADDWVNSDAKKLGTASHASLRTEVNNVIRDSLSGSLKSLIGYYKGGIPTATDGPELNITLPANPFKQFDVSASPWDVTVDEIGQDVSIYKKGGDFPDSKKDIVLAALPAMLALFEEFLSGMDDIRASASSVVTQTETKIIEEFPTYRNIVDAVKKRPTRIPPSGAIVGVFAKVDRTRGVWKAPANVSLAGIYGLSEHITHETQEGLNVDTTAGKSINAIRFFTGKGYLIWGARTLAGNDLEWRYVSVRRFFNMVEESIQKATGWVVFEPNDANTWVRVKGMVDNFLTMLWRQGALAGAKPDDAFFVNIGLGKTMTAVDILEGRLIVEVGLATVRPAEFIILKFMHKLQEAA